MYAYLKVYECEKMKENHMIMDVCDENLHFVIFLRDI